MSKIKETIQKGFELLSHGNIEKALELGNMVLLEDSNHLEAQILVGLSHYKNQSYLESIKLLELVVTRKPFDLVLSLYYLENLIQLGEYTKGLKVIRTKESILIDERVKLLKIKFLEKNSEYDSAIIEAIQIKRPENKLIKIETLAWNYELLNDIDKANEYAVLGLTLDRKNFRCNIIKTKILIRKEKYKKANRYLNNINIKQLSPTNASIFFSLKAQVAEKLKKYNKAFKYFTKSNTILKETKAYKLLEGRSYYTLDKIEIINEYFKKQPVFKELVPSDENVTFMVGFPRSGTTLLENILSVHSEITTIEEKPIIEEILGSVFGRESSLDQLNSLTVKDIKEIQKSYIQVRNIYNNTDTSIVIDKLPLNLIHVGILYRFFPNAKFIISLRDIRDVALSCYFQNFHLNDAMANFLDWSTTHKYLNNIISSALKTLESYPIKFVIVNYEEMVNNPFSKVKEVLGFLGLEWQDSIYDYRKKIKGKNISTPSYAAITKKINSKQKGRWQNYKKQTRHIDVKEISNKIKNLKHKVQTRFIG